MLMLSFAEIRLMALEKSRLKAALPSMMAIIRPSLLLSCPVMMSMVILPATLATRPKLVLIMPKTV